MGFNFWDDFVDPFVEHWAENDAIIGTAFKGAYGGIRGSTDSGGGADSNSMPSMAPSVPLPTRSAVDIWANGTPAGYADPYEGFASQVNPVIQNPLGGPPITLESGITPEMTPAVPGFLDYQAQQRADLTNRLGQTLTDYTSSINGILGGLTSEFDSLNASDQVALSNLLDAVAGVELAPLQLASSNPADVARQQQAYGMLMGIAGGSMDAHTNPEDLARQKKTADLLWKLAQSPELTAEERFIYEQQRRIEEQDRGAHMMAVMRNLASRGQLGSGAEIGANMDAQQITSQNRMLGDLGALANAMQRQMTALGQHSTLATNMRNASDAMSTNNMNRRASGAQGAAQTATAMRNASDDISMFNAGQTNNYNQAQTNLDMWKAQTPFNAQMGVNNARTGRATTLAGIRTDAAGNVFNASNLPLQWEAGWLSDDAQLGLTLAQQSDNWMLEWERIRQEAEDRKRGWEATLEGQRILAEGNKKKGLLGLNLGPL